MTERESELGVIGKHRHCGGVVFLDEAGAWCKLCGESLSLEPLPPRPTDSVVRDYSPRPMETVVGEADEGGIRPAVFGTWNSDLTLWRCNCSTLKGVRDAYCEGCGATRPLLPTP